MALETGTYISDLVVTNPVAADPKSQGDDHLRLLKATIKTTFPAVTGAVLPTHTELNFVDGVTSAIQTQLNLKAPLASPVLTGVPEAPTAAVGSNNTTIATTAFVTQASLTSSLPGQTGKNRYLISTDGTTADWYNTIDTSVVTPVVGTAFATTTATQTFTGKTATDLILANAAAPTKRANFDLSGITAGQNRTITVKDNNIILDTPGWVYLSTVTASASATADLETTIDSTYDRYAIVITGVRPTSDSVQLYMRLKVAGAYLGSASDYFYTSNTTTSVATIASDFSGLAQIPITAGSSVGNDTDRALSGVVFLDSPASTAFKKIVTWTSTHISAADIPTYRMGMGILNSNVGAVTGARFLFNTNTIAAGTFSLFGLRKA